MKNSTKAHSQEEILEHVWIYVIEDENLSISNDVLKSLVKEYDLDVNSILRSLRKDGDITIKENRISLTESGKFKGQQVVRRHRLAERLFHDVLDISPDEVNKTACTFEHVLNEDVEENICILLGHPTICPHNKPIPIGRCCEKRISATPPAVVALANVEPGHEGIVSYITTKKYKRLQKLMSLGVLPGSRIKVLRKSPGTVIKFDETVIALEPAVTQSIFLRKLLRIP
ncbi:MAG: metal-dependent transcriptional regulator [Candidatus Hodarchaeales archaeon]|jgi:DtxR family Mn-dependent transcriptional regulator